MTENELSTIIVNAAIEVHRTLGGPGLLESIYEEALVYELEREGYALSDRRWYRSCTKASAWRANCVSTCL